MPWCCASMKKARCRRSIGPSRCCRSHPARPSGAIMITNAMARRRRSTCSDIAHRPGVRPLLQTPPRNRVPPLPRCHQRCRAGRSRYPSVMNNYATHKAPIKAWFAKTASLSPPLHSHLRLLAQSGRALVRASDRSARSAARVHRSIKELELAVAAFIADHNAAPRPFLWTKSADQIFSSIARFAEEHETDAFDGSS